MKIQWAHKNYEDARSVISVQFCCRDMACMTLDGGFLDKELRRTGNAENWSFCPYCGDRIIEVGT